jgi:SOS response regulatory protein OraA/RecX
VAEGGSGSRRRPRRETHAEARERRAAVDDPEAVLAAAARLLESRHRTVHEVRDHLTRAGYRDGLVAGAIERLEALGYLDDEEFARAWVASRDRAHPRGERALRQELARKGVARETVDAILAERAEAAAEQAGDRDEDRADPGGGTDGPEATEAPSADEAAAERLLERRRASLERVADPRARRQRAYALLARSGFDPGTCADVAARFVRAAPDD